MYEYNYTICSWSDKITFKLFPLTCWLYSCFTAEMAMLLPADMSKSRRINDTDDTRHNVIAHYPEYVDHE